MKSLNTTVLLLTAVFISVLGGCDLELTCDPDVPELTEYFAGLLPYYLPDRDAFGDLADGTYTGELPCGMNRGEIEIVVEGNNITGCEIVEMIMSPYILEEGPGQQVIDEGCDLILEEQSPQFDAVTGATGVSYALQVCLARAMWEASADDDPMTECVPEKCQ